MSLVKTHTSGSIITNRRRPGSSNGGILSTGGASPSFSAAPQDPTGPIVISNSAATMVNPSIDIFTISLPATLGVPVILSPGPFSTPKITPGPSASSGPTSTQVFVSVKSLTSAIQTSMPFISPKINSTLSPASTTIPILTSPSFRAHGDSNSKHWVVPLSLGISILLVCSGLLSLYLRRKRTQKKLLPYIVPGTEGELQLDASPKRKGIFGQNSQEVTPFDLSPNISDSNFTHQLAISSTHSKGSRARRIMRTLRRSRFNPTPVRNKPRTTPAALPSVSIREAEVDADATSMKRSIPLQNALRLSSGLALENSLQASREETEVLQERLRVVENIALGLSDHTTGTDDARNLERELRELIPPPEYTNVSST